MEPIVPGRIVYFVFTKEQAAEVMRRRATEQAIAERMTQAVPSADGSAQPIYGWPSGAQAHLGNPIVAGTICPAMVVAVNGPSGNSNLKVMLDGTDVYWARSRDHDEAKTPGTWHWMYPGQATRGNTK